jgi:N-acetyl-1-D-myo-inositol-2-amino-2-deoxy-alpha-D-glucopyranoside deacetylase
LRAHATQITEDGPFFALSNAIGPEVFGIEYYQLVHGQADAPFDDLGRELDLFAGVSES